MINFYKGTENKVLGKTYDEALKDLQNDLLKIFDVKNLSILLGSGCSSYKSPNPDNADEKIEIGIPTMEPMAFEFYNIDNVDNEYFLLEADRKFLHDEFKINVLEDPFKRNIEKLMEVLFSLKFYYVSANIALNDEVENQKKEVDRIIDKAKRFILIKCLNKDNEGSDIELIEIYQQFYRKLLYRNTNLPKANIFTTNYDTYSEKAMDYLGIHYVNGFSGGINKYFNPTVFNYALAEKMDISQNKWNVIDNFIYLYKIHGSINWIEDDGANKMFDVKEVQDVSEAFIKGERNILIYPTPVKYLATMSAPYSDLFREFQKKLMQNNNVLITLGYSFSDIHINNLIFQAFTIPTFRLVIFGEENPIINKLKKQNDPRIWLVNGADDAGEKIHYFKNVVTKVLPDLSNDEIDEKITDLIQKLFKGKKDE